MAQLPPPCKKELKVPRVLVMAAPVFEVLVLNPGLKESAAFLLNCTKVCFGSSTLLILAAACGGREFSLHPEPPLQGQLYLRQLSSSCGSGTGQSHWLK